MLKLPLPPIQNHAYVVRGGRLVLSPEARAYQSTVWGLVRQQAADAAVPEPLELEVRWFLKHDRDIDGVKLVQDSVAAALGFDDRRVIRLVVSKKVDRHDPRCVVVLREA